MIHLYDNYYASQIPRNWVLIKQGVIKTGENAGKPSETVLGYYPNFKWLLSALPDNELKACSTLTEIKSLLDTFPAKIEAIAARYTHIANTAEELDDA